MTYNPTTATASLERFGYLMPEFAARYDQVRPAPPEQYTALVTQFLGTTPRLVVDIGSGTGLSTSVWANRAERALGVEPSPQMREVATRRIAASNVSFVNGFAEDTGLPDAAADLVSSSSSVTWFDAPRFYQEAARILRPAGLLAVLFHDYPPIVHPAVDAAFVDLVSTVDALMGGVGGGAHSDIQHAHAYNWDLLRNHSDFVLVRRAYLHQIEWCDANRLIGLALSSGSVTRLLLDGHTESDLCLGRLRTAVSEAFGTEPFKAYFGFTLWLAVRGPGE